MTGSTVAVIDYGMGNLHSVASALECVGAQEVIVSNQLADIERADRVVFPGVGAIRDCMAEIHRLKADDLLLSALQRASKPVLAICVGMQALMTTSEENGGVDCLDLIRGVVRRIPVSGATATRLKVPHMGWNHVHQSCAHPLWSGIPDGARFYFVHSYYVDPLDAKMTAASFNYGIRGCAALYRDNLFAVQFHPEKSHDHGLQLLKNFLNWNGKC